MAGHSQFKNIMHKKGKQDAIRSKLFSKLAREITVAAKMGLPDPAMNARLRAAVLEARAENMPKDNIDRAIKKASSADTSSRKGVTSMEAKLVWRRCCESKGDIRTRRCTPRSVAKSP